jgi:hypothetical protein
MGTAFQTLLNLYSGMIGLGDAVKLDELCLPETHSPDLRHALRAVKHFSSFEFFLLPNRSHARPSATIPFKGRFADANRKIAVRIAKFR